MPRFRPRRKTQVERHCPYWRLPSVMCPGATQ
uniref:Uncharacterized protein n=1 Tax=Anguilla anguilla TaxID=7936 RepID=A0A0E9WGV4_ANGAN